MVDKKTVVDEYWSEHTVRAKYFKSQKKSEKYSVLRLDKAQPYKEFIELEKVRNNEIILDYGCGPGNDIVNFIMNSKAKKIIGLDISEKALNYAKHQVSLYVDNNIPIEFIKIVDGINTIPLESNSIDYIICSGVLHHISKPLDILKEFFRLLKNNSYANIMVYNRDSIYFHLYVAYFKKGGFKGNNIDEIFAKNTDGKNCPISRSYRPEDFIKICNSVGFKTKYIGGYCHSADSPQFFNEYKQKALDNNNLAEEHKDFLRNVKINSDGYPIYNGKYCGIGGTYRLYKKE